MRIACLGGPLRPLAPLLAVSCLLWAACGGDGSPSPSDEGDTTLERDTSFPDVDATDEETSPDSGTEDGIDDVVPDGDDAVDDVAEDVDAVDATPDAPPVCGNGIVEPGEACDDGNRVDNDFCRNDCTLPRCGDGRLDRRRGRDLVFSPRVRLEGVATGYVCDDGSSCPESTCDVSQIPFATEHGICQALGFERAERVVWGGGPGEGVAPMLHAYNWNCLEFFCTLSEFLDTRADCTTREMLLEIECFGETGEECDNGEANADEADACRTNCLLPFCGDGIVDGDEACDAGRRNAQLPDRCRVDCTLPACGDGIVDSGEECDDGNTNDADFCRNDCRLPFCGDGVVQPGESCDEGEANSDAPGGTCRTNCRLPRCGDGITDPGEECDDGNFINNDGCTNQCRLPRCGDGITQPINGEECDDANDIDTDFCLSDCTLPVCGDGIQSGSEACDLGDDNSDEPDAACRLDCTLQRCGDGVVDTGEACDDGNPFHLDGCTNDCEIGFCGDGLRQRELGEECDDGNGLDGDGCSSACLLEGGLFPGVVAFIGHDFNTPSPAMGRLLWNVALLAETGTALRVLGYSEFANQIAGGDVQSANAALVAEAERDGVALTLTDVRSVPALLDALDDHDVLLIYEQQNASLTRMNEIGDELATDLAAFVARGGVVIVTDYSANTWRILVQSGLMPLQGPLFLGTSTPLRLARPRELVTDGLPDTFPASFGSRTIELNTDDPIANDVTVYVRVTSTDRPHVLVRRVPR